MSENKPKGTRLNEENYQQVPNSLVNDLQDGRLKALDFAVFMVFLNHLGDNPRCWVGNGKIAKIVGRDVRSVQRCVGRLKAAGYIQRKGMSKWGTKFTYPKKRVKDGQVINESKEIGKEIIKQELQEKVKENSPVDIWLSKVPPVTPKPKDAPIILNEETYNRDCNIPTETVDLKSARKDLLEWLNCKPILPKIPAEEQNKRAIEQNDFLIQKADLAREEYREEMEEKVDTDSDGFNEEKEVPF